MPRTENTRSRDGRFEIRFRSDDGPRDDFYGLEDWEWEVWNLETGKVVARYDGARYPTHQTGVSDVRFDKDELAIVVTRVEHRDLPTGSGEARRKRGG
jgi:hypothetical protein